MAEQRPRTITQGQDEEIQAYLFGGLNTTATPLNTPFEDSPLLSNMTINLEGSVVKRKGTQVLVEEEGVSPKGVAVQNFSSTLLYNLTVVKSGKNINIYEVKDNVATKVISKTNVFNDDAENVRPNTIRTSETEPRILFFTGTNKPVQLTFTERQQKIVHPPTNSVVFSEAQKFANATPTNCLCYINRVRTDVIYNYNALTKQLTVSIPTQTSSFVIDLILVTWQWWAESMYWKGDRYSKAVTRTHVNKVDQSIAIPASIRSDMNGTIGDTQQFPIFPYKRSTLTGGSGYCYASFDRAPKSWDNYAFGDGAPYNYEENLGAPIAFTNVTPFFITFGKTRTTSDTTACGGEPITACTPTSVGGTICEAESVYLIRRRELRLNNDEGIQSAFIDVYVNGTKRTRITNNASPPQTSSDYMRYWLHKRNPTTGTSVPSVTNEEVYYLSFEGVFGGLPGDADVEVINSNAEHIGSSAVGTRFNYDDGSYFPIYGIGLYADYKNGYYPSSCELYQGRLVLGGFSNKPLTALFSNVYDSVTPGVFFNFYQVTDDISGIAADPFDITFNSKPDDKLIATVEYQSSLFALTRKAVFRVFGSGGSFNINNNTTIFLSNIGCVNNNSYVKTDKDIVYLADTGVYNLAPQIENQEYQASELSIKIRNEFGITKDPLYEGLPWLEFDDIEKLVYLGYPTEGETFTNKQILIYNTTRSAWTRFDTPGNFHTFSGSTYVDRSLGNGFLFALTTYRNNITKEPADFALVRLNADQYIDFVRRVVSNGLAINYKVPVTPSFTYATTDYQQMYSVDVKSKDVVWPFDTLPIYEVEDVKVTLNGVRLINQVDYLKVPGGYVYLAKNPGAGKTLVITPRRPVSDSEVGKSVYGTSKIDIPHTVTIVDNLLQTNAPTTSSVVSGGVTRNYINATYNNNAVVLTGQAYLAYYSTPTFVNQTLRNLKVKRWVYAYFDNADGQPLFQPSDVNASSGQSSTVLLDTTKTKVNASITLVFNNENSGESSSDIYGFESLVWGNSLFDVNTPASAFQNFQLFKEPLTGTGYTYSVVIWSYDHATFRLLGYQIDGVTKGKRVAARYR